MAKYQVETYYTCSFKVTHYLDGVNEKELSNLEEFRTRDRKNCRDKNIGRIEVFVES